MNTLDLVDGKFVLTAGFRYRDWARQVLGMKYNHKTDTYVGPAHWATWVSVQGLFGAHLEISTAVATWGEAAKQFITGLLKYKKGFELPPGIAPLPQLGEYALMPHQEVDGWFLSMAGGGLAFSEMRTGKSGTIIAAIRRLNAANVLIVCTNGNRYTWEEEIIKWLPDASIVVISGTAPQRKKLLQQQADFKILHYDIMPKHSKQKNYGSMTLTEAQKLPKELNEIDFDAVVLDEAHFIKDPKAQRTRAAWAVGDAARYRFEATGTPIANNPLDLWSLLRFYLPGIFTSKNDFTERYALMAMNVFGGMDCFGLNPAHEEEFYQIFEPMYVRRLRKDVLPFLPEKSYSTVWVEMETKQAKAYKEMESSIAVIDDEVLVATDPLTRNTRLHQIAAATPVVGTTAEGKSTVEALTLPSCKVDALLDILDADEEQAVVFMQSRKLLNLVAEVLTEKKVTFAEFRGGMSDLSRETGRREFQTGKRRVALFLYDASPEGLDFSNCWRFIRLQPSPKMTKVVQGEDRGFGPAQTAEKIEIIDVITRGTVEADAHRSEIEKEVQMHKLVQDTHWTPRQISA